MLIDSHLHVCEEKYIGNYCDIRDNFIHIAYGVDMSFLRPVLVSAVSVLLNSSDQVVFHVFCDDVSVFYKEMLFLHEKYGAIIFLYRLDDGMYKNWPMHGWSSSIYKRFFMAPVISRVAEKFIYLDADIICNNDVSVFEKENLLGNIVAAVQDIDKNISLKVKEKFGIVEYFNSGVMLIDARKWNSEDCTQDLLNFLDKHGDSIKFYDQDALNVIFKNNVRLLGLKYNYPADCVFKKNHEFRSEEEQSPIFIHFMGGNKPWMLGVVGNDVKAYDKLEMKTPFGNVGKILPRNKSEAMRCFKNYFKEKNYSSSVYWFFMYLKMKFFQDKI